MSEMLTEEEARGIAREVLEACWVACQMAQFGRADGDTWLFRTLHHVTGGALSGWHRDGRARVHIRDLPILEMGGGGVVWLDGAQEPQPRETAEAAVTVALLVASSAKALAANLCALLRAYADGDDSAQEAMRDALAPINRATPGAVVPARLLNTQGACLTVTATHDGRPLRVTYLCASKCYTCGHGVEGPGGREWERYCAPTEEGATAEHLLHGALTHLALLAVLGPGEGGDDE